MCIRDRARTHFLVAEQVIVHVLNGFEFVRAVFARHHDLGTVSYTHLRAHETVLDLVCRLLLEKKTPI